MIKYFKPTSLTWWSAIVPLMCGLFVATLPLHGSVALVQTINSITGGTEPVWMINAGLAGIGLRAAV